MNTNEITENQYKKSALESLEYENRELKEFKIEPVINIKSLIMYILLEEIEEIEEPISIPKLKNLVYRHRLYIDGDIVSTVNELKLENKIEFTSTGIIAIKK